MIFLPWGWGWFIDCEWCYYLANSGTLTLIYNTYLEGLYICNEIKKKFTTLKQLHAYAKK